MSIALTLRLLSPFPAVCSKELERNRLNHIPTIQRIAIVISKPYTRQVHFSNKNINMGISFRYSPNPFCTISFPRGYETKKPVNSTIVEVESGRFPAYPAYVPACTVV